MRWLTLLLCLVLAAPQADAASGRKAKSAVVKKKPAAVKKTKKTRGTKRPETKPAAPAIDGEMERRWQELRQTLKPVAALKACEEFEREFPGSRHAAALRDIQSRAERAMAAQRTARIASDALEDEAGDADYRVQLARALRGDGNAAHRIAGMYGSGSNGLPQHLRRQEQWLQFAAELGNGAASWQLAAILNRAGQWSDAAKYEQRAVDQGYRPPPRLPTRTREY